MVFIRTKRITKNGKTYEYRYRQASVRVPGRKHPKSIHLGRVDGERTSPATLLNDETMARNQEALAAGKFVTEANPTGNENGPDEGPTTPVS